MTSSSCFFIEMIDGIPFCHFLVEDVNLGFVCSNYISFFELKKIFCCDDEKLEKILLGGST